MSPRTEIVIAGDEGFAACGARQISLRILGALAERPVVTVALAGGSTPRPVYRALAGGLGGLGPAEWSRVHFFWSDERWVPAGDLRSNVAAATDDILSALDLPPENIHVPRIEGDPAASAADYEREIRWILDTRAGETPRFDVILLGVGTDGHTASLFPGGLSGSASEPAPTRGLVVATRSPTPPHERISFSFELLAAARVILILASGEDKAEVVSGALNDNDRSLPVTRVEPSAGLLCWLLDKAASSRLR